MASAYALCAATAIFLATYVLISLRTVRRFPFERPAVAMLGGGLMLVFGPPPLGGRPASLDPALARPRRDLDLAANATILGAACNVLVVQVASRDGATVSMKDFVKAGFPVTATTLVLSTVLISVLVPG